MQQLPACQPAQENYPRDERELSRLIQSACALSCQPPNLYHPPCSLTA